MADAQKEITKLNDQTGNSSSSCEEKVTKLVPTNYKVQEEMSASLKEPINQQQNVAHIAAFQKTLARNVAHTADRFGVPRATDAQILKMIEQHADFFSGDSDTTIQLRVARKSAAGKYRHQLNFRSELVSNKSEVLRATMKQIKTAGIGPKHLLEVVDAFPPCATAVDFDPKDGLVKLWHFGCSFTVKELAALPNAPPALAAHLPFFATHGFSRVFCCGVDLKRASMNVYFHMHEGGPKDAKDVATMFRDLGLAQPPQDKLEYFAGDGSFTVTLRWDRKTFERVCVYVVPLSAPMPKDMLEFMETCWLPNKDASAMKHSNSTFVSCSCGKDPASNYFKQESDYHGSYHDLLGRVAQLGNKQMTAREKASSK